jgi:putative flippase GtrA
MLPRKLDLPLLRRFVFVGGSTAALCLGLTWALVEGLAMDTTIASTIALLVAVCYNYVLHYHWTFGSEAPHGVVLLKYLAMCVGALVVNALVMEVGVQVTSVHYLAVQIVAAGMVALWSLTISATWVFR